MLVVSRRKTTNEGALHIAEVMLYIYIFCYCIKSLTNIVGFEKGQVA